MNNLIELDTRTPNGTSCLDTLSVTGAANLLAAVEYVQALYDGDREGARVERKILVNGVEIHPGPVASKADAKRVIDQIRAGTYSKPDLPPMSARKHVARQISLFEAAGLAA